ncbi:heme peroxidase [Zopfochytrium polystomum]|nr:heme peroxidase [Zopfochytrium polystomum]
MASNLPAKYQAVARDIQAILKKPEWDDGSLGPVLVRLAWHASGTYSKHDGSGGSNGATMRFKPESTDGANAGLEKARAFLEPIKQKHPWISYADLWTLAGVVAIAAMGGPLVPWTPGLLTLSDRVDLQMLIFSRGRTDKDPKTVTTKEIPPNGRLPDASQGAQHIRDVFYRMGFNDKDIVALSGAHTLGRCHTDRSGYSGPWTNTPDRFSNQYFKLLTTVEWKKKKWDGPEQYADPDDELMMLPTDMALIWDPKFKPIVELYAKDKDAFYKDFASAFSKLLDLGVKRSAGSKL